MLAQNPMVVWVDPQDCLESVWWIAMLIPLDQVDDSMPSVKKNEFIVTYWDKTPKL
jgi:hypothetical protein